MTEKSEDRVSESALSSLTLDEVMWDLDAGWAAWAPEPITVGAPATEESSR